MLDFFDTIVTFFETIWDIVVNLITSLINLLQVAITAVNLPAYLITAQLPAIIVASLSAVTAISIAKLLVGR